MREMLDHDLEVFAPGVVIWQSLRAEAMLE
jgi:hypothetical protein